eukprot:COSAG01_NODE_6420_length_3677_cov_4.065120_4_plen_71_part_00
MVQRRFAARTWPRPCVTLVLSATHTCDLGGNLAWLNCGEAGEQALYDDARTIDVCPKRNEVCDHVGHTML